MKVVLPFNHPVGFGKILGLLSSEDSDVQIQAVKLVANLAAEGTSHLTIVKFFVITKLYLDSRGLLLIQFPFD